MVQSSRAYHQSGGGDAGWSGWKLTAAQVGAAAMFGVMINDRVMSVCRVRGPSMQPTLNPDSYESWVLVDRQSPCTEYGPDSLMSYLLGCPKYVKGEIYLFRSPEKPDRVLAKRLVATENEWIYVSDCNWTYVARDTARFKPAGRYGLLRVPKGYGWLEGDNRDHSRDSRHFGPVPLALLKSRVTTVLWPPSELGRSVTGQVGAPELNHRYEPPRGADGALIVMDGYSDTPVTGVAASPSLSTPSGTPPSDSPGAPAANDYGSNASDRDFENDMDRAVPGDVSSSSDASPVPPAGKVCASDSNSRQN